MRRGTFVGYSWAVKRVLGFLCLALFVLLVACCAPSGNRPGAPVPLAPSAAAANPAPLKLEEASESDAVVPIDADDPVWGARDALVTMVEFADFECPYCARASQTLERLLEEYGPTTLRLVFKHEPLSFHVLARPAAEAAVVVRGLGGNDAFWSFYRSAYGEQKDLSPAAIEGWVSRTGIAPKAFRDALAAHRFSDKIDRDHTLAHDLGVSGTPAFFVNGVLIGGAQPYEKFKTVIDAELAKAKQALAKGIKADVLYRTLAAQNFKVPGPGGSEDAAEDTKTVWRIPVGTGPSLGPATALVTIVEFGDFQCPYCRRVEPTLKALRAKYGDNLRLVWRNGPLPFHEHAEPAARFALEARAEKGDAGFWDVHDRLFNLPSAAQPAGSSATMFDPLHPDAADLDAIARAVGLDLAKTHDAVAKKKYQKALDEDADLREDVQADGTPHFFINGRRLVGAHPLDRFVTIIDEEILKAKALLQNGTAPKALYEELMKAAQPMPPPERRAVAPAEKAPFRGAANAPVTIIEFADLQCPYCRRAEETLAEVLKNYGGKVRVQWRNLPLPMHPDASLAAEAAMEAYQQKGNDGFWKFHDKVFAAQDTQDGLKRAALERYAVEVGLDLPKLAAALYNHSHKAEIDADAKTASDADITGTPAFIVNGYFISGAEPYAKFRRKIDLALAEATAARKP